MNQESTRPFEYCFTLMTTQSFLYNAIFFTSTSVQVFVCRTVWIFSSRSDRETSSALPARPFFDTIGDEN